MKHGLAGVLFVGVAASTLFSFSIAAQTRKTPRSATPRPKSTPLKKVEIEDWKDFDVSEGKVRLLFPKVPTVTVSEFEEIAGPNSTVVKSTVAQAEINSDFYLVEVREYPVDFLPDREDLAQDYGLWLRNYVLRRSTVISEKNVDFGRFAIVEFVYQDSPTEIVVHRAMVAGRKLYQLIVHIDKKETDSNDLILQAYKAKIAKFFISFDPYDELVVEKSIG